MQIRTDLAKEAIQNPNITKLDGITEENKTIKETEVNEVKIETDEAAKRVNKPKGSYITINISSFLTPCESEQMETEVIAEVLEGLIPKGRILVAGLGNTDITPDAIGPLSVSNIFATRHINLAGIEIEGLENLRDITAVATGVLGKTGLESAETVKCICEYIKPDCVIVIDALACSEPKRLGTTVQITDSGIAPGSGVKNARKELSKSSLGVPVIAIGVPTVIDASVFSDDEEANNMMVTPRDIDAVIARASRVLSLAINKALLPSLSFSEIECLIN